LVSNTMATGINMKVDGRTIRELVKVLIGFTKEKISICYFFETC